MIKALRSCDGSHYFALTWQQSGERCLCGGAARGDG